jgi:DNA invertase Pin-like site-specific DNA recombinase
MATAIAYLRVSTDDQELGPVAQREAITRWCEGEGLDIVGVYEDRGVSGAAPLDKRTGLMAAIGALAEHGATALVVAKRDRLARDTLAAAMIERLTEKAGARVLCVGGVGNDDSPEGLLMRRMVDAFAEYERAMIRARIKAAMAVKKGRRELVGAVPYGYQLADDGVHLEPDPREQRVIAKVQEYRRQGLSLRRVGERMAKQGIAPRSGGKWHAETVKAYANAQEVAA